MSISIIVAQPEHIDYAEHICELIFESAKQRGTGIAKRSPEYIADKIRGGKAVIALDDKQLVGFSYIECWGHGDFIATSGLIVAPEYRHKGIADKIKRKTFQLARERFPYAKIFSITTSLPVMKLNTRMGYVPVTFSELTDDAEFWAACKGCVNYDVLQRNGNVRCICTGMLYDPAQEKSKKGNRLFSKQSPYIIYFINRIKKILTK